MMRRNLAAASLAAAVVTTADAFPQKTWLAGGAVDSSYHIDGDAKTARFNNVDDVAIVLGTGDLIVADKTNQVLRAIAAADGKTTTLAGTSRSTGSTDALGTAAKFYNPLGLAVDAAGNTIVCDNGNNAIRKVTSGGTVTTVAGGTYGFADGTGTAAKFRKPDDAALNGDAAYVLDRTNYLVRKVVVDTGVTTTVAGTGANSIRDMGKVMGALKSKYTGQMDFGKVGPLVKDQLCSGGDC